MRPERIVQKRTNKDLQILHICTGCGKVQPNKVALNTVQDDFDALVAFMAATSRALQH
jgi:hypothetical protein